MARTTFRDRNLLEAIDILGVVPLQVDLTQVDGARREFFDRIGGRAIPYIVLLDGQGRPVQRYTGMVAVDTLVGAHPQMVILPDICVALKTLSSEYQPSAYG